MPSKNDNMKYKFFYLTWKMEAHFIEQFPHFSNPNFAHSGFFILFYVIFWFLEFELIFELQDLISKIKGNNTWNIWIYLLLAYISNLPFKSNCRNKTTFSECSSTCLLWSFISRDQNSLQQTFPSAGKQLCVVPFFLWTKSQKKQKT